MYLLLSKWLEGFAFILTQKSLYFELKHYIKKKETYFKSLHYYSRGIGKTFTLIKLAKKYKCPIAVSTNSSIMHIKNMCKKHNIKEDIELIPCSYMTRGKRREVILCDEGISQEFLNEVLKPMCNHLIGFIDKDSYSNQLKFEREYKSEWIRP